MRFLKLSTSITIIILSLVATPVFANTNNFYFDDYTADYYLAKDGDGESRLRVVEKFTAVFPNYDQNKGICRQIPYTNQNGINITLPYLSTENITVLRNGTREPIYSIDRYDGHFEVCTGDDDYVHGTQEYTFEYEFSKVVTDFDSYQELYWDTNGNGWSQKFNSLMARVHFVGSVADDFTGKSWCYVGKYGDSGQKRCTITNTNDGVEFSTSDLAAGENLTFDIELKPGAFVIPEPQKDYTLVVMMIAVGATCAVFLLFAIWKFFKNNAKYKYYKNYFVKPEYQPHKDYTVAEMAEIFIGFKKDAKVAVLLDMIVKKKISLRKAKSDVLKLDKWIITVNDVSAMQKDEVILLTILNDGSEPMDGTEIEVKVRSATSAMIRLAKKYDTEVLARLKSDELVEPEYKVNEGTASTISTVIVVAIVLFMLFSSSFPLIEKMMTFNFAGKIVVGEEFFWPVTIVMVVGTIAACAVLKAVIKKYQRHTLRGLEMSRYMDGLKLYIKMAEADRMKMLQSVNGADVSPAGIVKLYEKLLPYAAVFGLEESWMNEMSQYCKLQEVTEPDFLLAGITISELSRTIRFAAGAISVSSHYSSSSVSGGGSYSSGFSGGGGGGFSGGGGGGGGGGGR